MTAYPQNKHKTKGVIYVGNQPVIIAFDVKHDPVAVNNSGRII